METLRTLTLIIIWLTLMGILNILSDIRDDRVMRVTEIKRDYHIRNFFGDIPTGADIVKGEKE